MFSDPTSPGLSAADRALLHDHLVTRRADYARFLMRWAVVMTVAWWLTDPVLLRGVPGGVAAFAAMRVSSLLGSAVVLLILRGARALEGPRLAACALVWMALTAGMAASLSTLGDFSTFWFHGLYPVVIVTAFFPFELRHRALFAGAIAASTLGGFVLARPSAASPPFFGPTVGYMVFTVGVAVTFGHMYFLVTCEAFRQRLTIAAQREDLRRQVDQRTDELRRLAAHLDRVSEEERRRIARELHDDLGQSVSALRVSLATARRRFERDPASIGANLGDLDELARRVADSARDALTHLRPRVLDDLGLAAAARWLAHSVDARGDVAVTLTVEGDEPAVQADAEGRSADEVSVAAFRVLQEALTNVTRHARATRAEVTLRFGDAVELTVEDDGVGPGEGSAGRGLGVLGMRERARALGGSFSIEPRPGGGTRVTCALPRRAGEAAA